MFEMDWANESYARLHIRDTVSWLKLPFEAQAVWMAMLRKMDRAGIVEAPDGAEDVAAILRWPVEFVAAGLDALLKAKGGLVRHPRGYVWPEYIPANETPKSDPLRKRESRERASARAVIAAELAAPATSHAVTPGHAAAQPVTNRDHRSQNVTARDAAPDSGHAGSHAVTLTCSPSLTDLVLTSPEDPDARAGAHAREARTGPESRPDVPCGTGEEAEPEDPIDFQRELLRRAAVDDMTEEQWAEWDRKVIANREANPIPHAPTRRANA